MLALTLTYDAILQVDVSSPMHHMELSTNYAEAPWNTDPANHETPPEFEGMAIQPLGNRKAVYDDMIQGCIDFYKDKGYRCKEYESDRVKMTLRQPQSMEVSSAFVLFFKVLMLVVTAAG